MTLGHRAGKRRLHEPGRDLERQDPARTQLGAGSPGAAFDPGPPANAEAYLDRLAIELASWSERLARACDQPHGGSREARISRRKRVLVSKVRIRNIERRLADMRGSRARFDSMRPGLLLLWNLLTAGIEQDEAKGEAPG